MSNSSGSLSSIINGVLNLFSKQPATTPPPAPATPPDSATEPIQIVTSRVLMVIFDPVVDAATSMKLSQKMNWKRADELAAGYSSDILECSGGVARYQIVQRIELNEFPVFADGFQYTASSYLPVLNRSAQPHAPEGVNYTALLSRFNIMQRVANNEIDEVWFFAFPHAGFYESIMGGYGAFFCNSNPLPNTATCPRRFVLMGFSMERGVGEMLESFGHRSEFSMGKAFARVSGDANLYKKFALYDKIAPGKANIGSIHYAPNSNQDYDWGNTSMVASYCDDWYNLPNFKGTVKQVNCVEWGNGEIRAHHKWWLKHLPKVAGRKNGVANNWWQYIVDPNRISV